MKKVIYLMCAAGLAMCVACSSNLAEDDYAGAYARYVAETVGTGAPAVGDVTVRVVSDITVGDSIDYITAAMSDEYEQILAAKKEQWEQKQADCEKDELANVLRHQEHMKNYEKLKRLHGNDLKYREKIEGYRKAAEKLPSNHEEYVAFDRRRSYSFTADAERLKADYEEFQALGVEQYVAESPRMAQYAGRDRNEVIATIAGVTTDGEETLYVFGHKPMRCLGMFMDAPAGDLDNENAEAPAQETEEE